jgi:hypothetical protein
MSTTTYLSQQKHSPTFTSSQSVSNYSTYHHGSWEYSDSSYHGNAYNSSASSSPLSQDGSHHSIYDNNYDYDYEYGYDDNYVEIDAERFKQSGELLSKHLSVTSTKGESDVHRIQLKDIDKMLAVLRRNSNRKVSELKGDLKRTYDRFNTIVELTAYPYSSVYLKLYRRVERHFGDLRTVNHGTIGSYCIGCNLRTNLPPELKDYSPICSLSAPLPDLLREIQGEEIRSELFSLRTPERDTRGKSGEEQKSDGGSLGENLKLPVTSPHDLYSYPGLKKRLAGVYVATEVVKKDKSGKIIISHSYQLTELLDPRADKSVKRGKRSQSSESKNIGVIFLPERTYQLFKGFSEAEKNVIRDRGIERCILYCTTDDGRMYIPVVSHTPSIRSGKTRRSNGDVNSSSLDVESSKTDDTDDSEVSNNSLSEISSEGDSEDKDEFDHGDSSENESRLIEEVSYLSNDEGEKDRRDTLKIQPKIKTSFDSESPKRSLIFDSESPKRSRIFDSESPKRSRIFDSEDQQYNSIHIDQIKTRVEAIKWKRDRSPIQMISQFKDRGTALLPYMIVGIVLLILAGVAWYVYVNRSTNPKTHSRVEVGA